MVSPVLIETLSGKKTNAGRLTPISFDSTTSNGLSKLFTGSFSQPNKSNKKDVKNLIDCKNKP